MSLRGTIAKAVDTAFKAVGDLAENVILKTTSSSSYDFSTGTVNAQITESTVRAIILYADQDPTTAEVLSPRKEVLIKETELPDPKLFDTVLINDKTHSILSYKVEPGLVTLLVTEA